MGCASSSSIMVHRIEQRPVDGAKQEKRTVSLKELENQDTSVENKKPKLDKVIFKESQNFNSPSSSAKGSRKNFAAFQTNISEGQHENIDTTHATILQLKPDSTSQDSQSKSKQLQTIVSDKIDGTMGSEDRNSAHSNAGISQNEKELFDTQRQIGNKAKIYRNISPEIQVALPGEIASSYDNVVGSIPMDENNNVVGSDRYASPKRKQDIFENLSVFKEVDKFVLNIPKGKTQSMKTLAEYINASFDSDLLRIRALWRWITANIEYDVDTFFGKTSQKMQGDAFANRKGVCEGYATITNDLFSLCGIECVKISGWSKGYYYTPGQSLADKKTNHAWNAVKIQNNWWLCDFTWGAGYVSQDKKFVWDYSEHYFLTDPEEFIFDHFPVDPNWQLLASPVSIYQFQSWAKFSKHFFIYNLKPLSHKEAVITVNQGKLIVTIEYVDGSTEFTASLIHDEFGSHLDEYLFQNVHNGHANFQINFPKVGFYTLKLFAKPASSIQKEFTHICTYKLNCEKVASNCSPFPKKNGSWRQGFILYEPLTGVLEAGSEFNFKIATPNRISEMFLCIKGDNNWLPMSRELNHIWEKKVTISEAASQVKVLGKDANSSSNSYSVLLTYKVNM